MPAQIAWKLVHILQKGLLRAQTEQQKTLYRKSILKKSISILTNSICLQKDPKPPPRRFCSALLTISRIRISLLQNKSWDIIFVLIHWCTQQPLLMVCSSHTSSVQALFRGQKALEYRIHWNKGLEKPWNQLVIRLQDDALLLMLQPGKPKCFWLQRFKSLGKPIPPTQSTWV